LSEFDWQFGPMLIHHWGGNVVIAIANR